MRLFCFPYAGASAMVYQRWRRQVPDWLDIKPVELPGRGIRLPEPLVRDWEELITTLVRGLTGDIRQPYALFGHSFGALVAFETAHALREYGVPLPSALLVSGSHAPTRRDNRRFENLQDDDALKAEMRRLNGTDAVVFASEELMALTLPVLRADFRLCGRYVRRDRAPLAIPVHVLAGVADETTPATLEAWRTETTGGFTLDYFDGDHFFIQSCEEPVLATLCRYLERTQAADPDKAIPSDFPEFTLGKP
ncbi:thioesterase II family protein [Methylomicrobium sp. RS1]|uniref:thioesterase II family protein n=1 Tax=Candidatus Methylomicrobium oryzae TaxID=2802053 RepID=UPI001921AD3A|nr:alpha/beta fold hydrolase [Methylomicrobium sp. RS1]MBL1265172.1 thioesterase [Methylomicrobium sp. RS1]